MGIFNCAHIWKVGAIDWDHAFLEDMRGTMVKTHCKVVLDNFEVFIPPDDEPKVKWKTKYLGVVL